MKRGRKRTHLIQRPVAKTQRNSNSKKPGKSTKLKKVIYVISVCIFIALIACAGVGVGMYAAISQEISEMNFSDLSLTRSSIVYYDDKDGNSHVAATLFSDGNCIWVESDKIADVMKEAIVSIEDERFYEHNGVDLKRTLGAFVGYVGEKIGLGRASYGGSTITQQVVKNITKEKDRTAMRKIKEMMRAVAIEKTLSKDEILTMYLNIIFLANNCYGIEAASNMYFDKSAAELELHEAALIAGITQRPSYYDPLDNPENAVEKRNTVLLKMYEHEKISKEEYEAAKESDIGLMGLHEQARSNVYSYFVDNVINNVIRDLQTEKGYTEAFAKQQVYSGGLKIYTTMDIDVQTAIETVFENEENFSGGASKAQAAMVIIDPATGQVKGLVGGKGQKMESRGFNRATQMTRQPGSSIKPLSVYTPAIEEGVFTPTDIVVDEPIKIKDWSPKNSYSGFKGPMNIKTAVTISANIPAVKVVQKTGVSTAFDYAKNKFHLSTIQTADRDISPMALGGLTNGVSVIDMAAAYSVFANNGVYIEPYSYTKVLDSSNRVLLENSTNEERVISEEAAYIMTDMLYGVVNNAGGTGRAAKFPGMAIYGKTGTTNNDNDKWFVGYTKYYTGAVWFGFDTPKSIRSAGITGNVSARLWKSVMQTVHEGLDPAEITPPEGMTTAYACYVTGKLAGSNCDSVHQYYKSGTQPKRYCSEDHIVVEPVEDPEAEITVPEGENQGETQTPEGETPTPPEENPGVEPEVTPPVTGGETEDGVVTIE